MRDCEESGSFISGFIIGSFLGAVIAALTTPYTGSEVKENLSTTYKTGLDKAKDLKHKTQQSFTELKDLTQDKTKHLIGSLKERAENIAHRFDNMTAKGASILIDDEIV
jgi:gas vesicle protein